MFSEQAQGDSRPYPQVRDPPELSKATNATFHAQLMMHPVLHIYFQGWVLEE